jgi:hypothetical protein
MSTDVAFYTEKVFFHQNSAKSVVTVKDFFFCSSRMEVNIMNARLLFLCTANSPCNGGLMMRKLPRVEATGCMRRLFLYAPGKTLTDYKNWIL